ncbi:hypothetical protein [Streptomyces sp. NPDC003327]
MPLLVATVVVTVFTTVGGTADDPAGASGAVGDTYRSGAPEADARTDDGASGDAAEGASDGAPDGVPHERHADPHEQSTSPLASPTPRAPGDAAATPSRPTASRTPASPAPTTSATGGSGSGPAVSYDVLRVGDCFDMDRDAPGTVVRRPCDAPHDAEVVARPRLPGPYADDPAVREAATQLCRLPLRLKAERQPAGTRWTTFVQYPYRTSYLLGSDTAACSLAAPSGDGTGLTRPLL